MLCGQAGGSYNLSWSTVDGGGSTSTGGVFSVSGTIGQPDAGFLNGGNYTLVGGFWGIATAIQMPGAPLLSVAQLNNNTVVVYWPRPATGFVLEQTTTLDSPAATISWSLVPFPYQTNTTHIFITMPPAGMHQFYRLWKP